MHLNGLQETTFVFGLSSVEKIYLLLIKVFLSYRSKVACIRLGKATISIFHGLLAGSRIMTD